MTKVIFLNLPYVEYFDVVVGSGMTIHSRYPQIVIAMVLDFLGLVRMCYRAEID